PEDVNVTSRGRLFRPVGIVPLSPQWSSYQLEAHEQAVAIYLFEEGISFREGLTVTYQGLSNDSWTAALPVLDRERARVRARARLAPQGLPAARPAAPCPTPASRSRRHPPPPPCAPQPWPERARAPASRW